MYYIIAKYKHLFMDVYFKDPVRIRVKFKILCDHSRESIFNMIKCKDGLYIFTLERL